jgi:hypothetical protein
MILIGLTVLVGLLFYDLFKQINKIKDDEDDTNGYSGC